MASSKGARVSPVRAARSFVEDEVIVALLLENMLAALGHTVIGPAARLDKAMILATQEIRVL